LRRSIEDDGPSVMSAKKMGRVNTTKHHEWNDLKNTRFNFLHQLASRKKHQ